MESKPSRVTFRKRLDDMVATLREDIVTGKREVGEYLPSEVSLGEQFQLSKNSVRKGLDILVAENLIHKVPRVGNQVSKPVEEGLVTIRFGYYKSLLEEAALVRLLAEFHKEYPHIRVEMVPVPYDDYYDTVSEYLNQDLLDVVSINNNHFQSFIDEEESGVMEPLACKPDLYSFIANAFQHDDLILARPLIFSPVVLCYNRDHFVEKNIAEPDSSWQWKDLMEVAAQLTDDQGRYGFFFHLISDNRWPLFLLQSGMNMKHDENGQVHLCDTKLMASMGVCRDLASQKGIFPNLLSEKDEDTLYLFSQGKISMIISSYFGLNHIRNMDFSFDVAPVPYLHDSKTLLLTIGLFVNRRSKVKHAANTFVDYMTSYKSQLLIRQQTLSIPSDKKAAEWTGQEDVKFARPSRFYMYREIVPTFRFFTELQMKTREMALFRNEMRLYWSGMEDESSVCARLEQLLSKSV
ncbi:extracellular solute-binding protein [Paenibacillus marinisediminis]